ncbi:ABC transporter ATP-binding protein [Occultella kanbiaonis]|uniref:ABC transporter ATP-binding protein n=1 Tax=Occultella kanbiaonis TaxID=2675754 RepID=UPI0012B74283|nr:ATP-binding cassette domain-containing protein [Occultella kanbiaonis]
MSSEHILSVRNLSATIAGQQVVEDVSLDVPATGVTALLGRNGVGKTSTIKAILGLIQRRGVILLDDVPIEHEPTHRIVQRGVGYVPEDREVFAGLTVAENLKLAQRGPDAHWDIVETLFPDLVQRSAQLAGTLSGGQQQMVSLARALLNPNRLLLVDEPTKGLAPKIVNEVAEALVRAAELAPILLVEQNLAVVRTLARDVVVVSGGRVVHTGPAADFLDDPELVRRHLGVHGDPLEGAPAAASTAGSANSDQPTEAPA